MRSWKNKKKDMFRTKSVIHLVLLLYWVCVHVYDASIVQGLSNEDRKIAFPAYGKPVGRWRYLTYINLWLCLAYSTLAFLTDVIPRSLVKRTFQNSTDFLFTSIVFPLSVFVPVAFWCIYAVDREGIYEKVLDSILPSLINHFWHTFVAATVLIEMLLVHHPYHSSKYMLAGQAVLFISYIILAAYIKLSTGSWMYPFLDEIPISLVPVFFIACFVLSVMFCFIGKGIAHLRWGGHVSSDGVKKIS